MIQISSLHAQTKKEKLINEKIVSYKQGDIPDDQKDFSDIPELTDA